MSQESVGEIFAKKYRLEERLGEGKFKETWRATDIIMNREVALKIFKEQNTGIDQIIHEATLQTKLGKHENIAEIYDAAIDTETNKGYISEEYIKGYTLAKSLERYGRIKNANLVRIAQQILNGLMYAHKQGIIHRDLKADNVFVQINENQEPKIILTDWGGSAESGTITGMHGSILVRPPEAFDGKIDEKTDIYGLGSLLYKLATGNYPFEGNSYAEIEQKIKGQEPQNLNLNPNAHIKPDFASLIMKMLNKDPAKRPRAKQAKRKIWINEHSGEILIASLAVPTLIGGIIFAAMWYFWDAGRAKENQLMYLSKNTLNATTIKYRTTSQILQDITEYAVHPNETIFAATNKDILAYSIKNKKLHRPPSKEEITAINLTKTPDKEEIDLQISPSGNLLAFRIGKDLHIIGTDGTWERKVLENIDEYVWYPQKDQITYRKGDTIFLADTQEAPYAEKGAREIAKGTCPRWASGGKGIWYLRKENDKKYRIVKGYGHSDNVGLKNSREMKTEIDKSVQEIFVPNPGYGFAMFTPKSKEFLIVMEEMDPYCLELPDFQDLREIAFDSDARGMAFSGKLTSEHDYEIFYHRIGTRDFIRITNNQEDDIMPLFITRKSLK